MRRALKQKQRSNILVLLVVFIISILNTASIQNVVRADDDVDTARHYHEEESIVNEVVHEVVKDLPPDVVDDIIEEVIEDEVESAPVTQVIEDIAEEVLDPVLIKKAMAEKETVTSKTSEMMNSMKTKTNDIIKRIQSMNQNDIKKVAAAGLGVWGVSLAVGWLVAK